jgi:small-conductance mechanosensitive channel
MGKILPFLFCLYFLCCFPLALVHAETAGEVSLEGVAPDQVDSVLAKLSDEQVRSLLIAELEKNISPEQGQEQKRQGFVAHVADVLHLLDGDDGNDFSHRLQRSLRNARSVPTDLDWALRQFAENMSISRAWKNVGIVLLLFFAAFLVELFFHGLTHNVRRQFREHMMPDLVGMMRFWGALLQQLPVLVHYIVFSGTALLLYFWSPAAELSSLRYLFLDVLFIIIAVRMVRLISLMFCSPDQAKLRLLPVTDKGAGRLHVSIVFLCTYLIVVIALLALLRVLEVQSSSLSILAIGFASVLLLLIAALSLFNRREVAEYLLSGEVAGNEEASWLMQQFSGLWHVLVFGYLLTLWGFLIYNEFGDGSHQNGAFLFSLFVLPVFVVLDRLSGWVVRSVVKTMRIYDVELDEEAEDYEEQLTELKYKEHRMVLRIWRFARLGVLVALIFLVLSLWGYHIPYAGAIVNALFDILLTLTAALIFWRIASNYIERKIKEATPEEKENEAQDDEWGAAGSRGRSYTLLPMVRKFLGTVLVVMVTLIIFSSLGVDIGPLLAGAGVIGLAIGFGAQKLVSDVFSGFFYLLDDAFRVGEYLQAGSVSGAVEAITLRNVMLRHHRGMLQIVPYSELGAITNFMRGGIVVKFNLEFPYDSDIDKIRKIIKKTGQAMLKDEEFGKDFIRPVKSQGVREITNSVMLIRVKFTAQPGTHFVIRREAYRRITEALAAKGIHYAHRKVIVELPHEENDANAPPTPQQMQRALEAGAAAGKVTMDTDEAEKAKGKGGSGAGMPGM